MSIPEGYDFILADVFPFVNLIKISNLQPMKK